MEEELIELKRTAYHEIGHLLANYICYGNIERYESASVSDFGGMSYVDPEKRFNLTIRECKPIKNKENFDFWFNQCCVLLGGMVLQHLMTQEPYDYDGASQDIETIRNCLAITGFMLCTEELIKVCDKFLSIAFIKYKPQVEILAEQLVECYEIDRLDFYRVFDKKLFMKERRKMLKQWKGRAEAKTKAHC